MKKNDHFLHIYWFIVGLCSFGAALTIFAIMKEPRCIDIALTFWLSTAVAGGIGYLIGSSVGKKPDAGADPSAPGATSTEITASVTTTPGA